MPYRVQLIGRAEQKTSTWPGGTTTQLAIYPEASDYKERNFLWRLSSASVEVEESVFTSLPGINRHIMLIEGSMRLIHEGHREVTLKPFQQDSFSGGWTTRSIGKARDFNLMLGQGSRGELGAISVRKDLYLDGTSIIPDTGLNCVTQSFYCVEGNVCLRIEDTDSRFLNEGELLILQYPVHESKIGISIKASGCTGAVVIRAGISHV